MEVMEIFKLPENCVKKIKVTKKELKNSASLLKGDETIIDYYIDTIIIEAIISSQSTNIPTYKEGNIYYPYFMLLTANIRLKEKALKVIEFIQRVIPNHMLLVIKCGTEIMFSCALKETKEDDVGITIRESICSPWIDMEYPDEEEKKFVKSLELNNQSFDNLYKTYRDFYSKVNHSKLIEIMGYYPDYVFKEDYDFNSEISAIGEISSAIEDLNREKDKAYNHQKKMECFMKIKTYSKKIEELKDKIRGQYYGQA